MATASSSATSNVRGTVPDPVHEAFCSESSKKNEKSIYIKRTNPDSEKETIVWAQFKEDGNYHVQTLDSPKKGETWVFGVEADYSGVDSIISPEAFKDSYVEVPFFQSGDKYRTLENKKIPYVKKPLINDETELMVDSETFHEQCSFASNSSLTTKSGLEKMQAIFASQIKNSFVVKQPDGSLQLGNPNDYLAYGITEKQPNYFIVPKDSFETEFWKW